MWTFASPLCGQANIHHYWPPFQWITVKYRSNACQIEIIKYVQSIGIEIFLLISIWFSLRNLQIPSFTTIVPLRHILWSPIRPLPGKPSSSRGGGGGRIIRALTAFYILEDFRSDVVLFVCEINVSLIMCCWLTSCRLYF